MVNHLVPASSRLNKALREESYMLFPEIRASGSYITLPDPHKASSRLIHFLVRWLPRTVGYSKTERRSQFARYQGGKEPRGVSTGVRLIASTVLALLGGSLLIVPMVIMSFNPGRTKNLVTVSCSVLLFAFFLGAGVRSKSAEVFIATATYAAVLVVFVGTNGAASG